VGFESHNGNGSAEDHGAPVLGIECRACGCRMFYTLETRRQADRIMRRKMCRHCGKRLTTYEKAFGTP
jgi:ribosomal protein L33